MVGLLRSRLPFQIAFATAIAAGEEEANKYLKVLHTIKKFQYRIMFFWLQVILEKIFLGEM